MTGRERLVNFLYVLLRDRLPSGEVESVMHDHVDAVSGGDSVTYSNPHVEAHARELADRILGSSS